MASAFVRARIDEKLKEEASEVLAEFGLTVSDIVRMTLTRIAKDHAVPLELKAPNAETRAAMRSASARRPTSRPIRSTAVSSAAATSPSSRRRHAR